MLVELLDALCEYLGRGVIWLLCKLGFPWKKFGPTFYSAIGHLLLFLVFVFFVFINRE
jgi:hypothetical protein